MPNESDQTRIKQLSQYFKENSDKLLEDFFSFLRFQSISSEAEYKDEMLNCANWTVEYLKNSGFDLAVWETSGHPVVYAECLEAGPDQPTVLIYNHYDVQPVDPLELWESPPFEPTIRDGEIYARGAQDNKGQCFYVMTAMNLLRNADGKLPVNVKLCIEGEEEVGSSGLDGILQERAKELSADYLMIVDLGLQDRNIPAVTLGVRGMLTLDIEVIGAASDLHSGSHGGVVYNPNHALVELLAKLRDENGRITVPGFYDDILEISAEERERLSFDFDEKLYQKVYGAKPTGGETKYSVTESNWLRPTLEINGIGGGYTGSGFKTVIPAKAIAKISCRLVPNQDPEHIAQLVIDFLKSNAPDGVVVNAHIRPGTGTAVRTNADSRIVQAVASAYSEMFNKPCRYHLEGATIPIVTELAKTSGAEVVLMGYGLGDDNIHAPNEHFGLDRLELGALTIARTLDILTNK